MAGAPIRFPSESPDAEPKKAADSLKIEVPSPSEKQQETTDLIQSTTSQIQEFHKTVAEWIKNPEAAKEDLSKATVALNTKLAEANAVITQVKDSLGETKNDVVENFRSNIEQLQKNMPALPKETQEALKNNVSGLSAKLKLGLDWTANKVSDVTASAFEKMTNSFVKIGEVFIEFIDKLKPQLAVLASQPWLKYFIGEERAKWLQEFTGYDPTANAFMKEIITRLPDDPGKKVVLDTETSAMKNMILFNDAYNEYLQLKKTDASKFPKIMYYNELVNGKGPDNKKYLDYESLGVNAEGNRILLMADVAKAAADLNSVERDKAAKAPAAAPSPVTPTPAVATPSPAPTA